MNNKNEFGDETKTKKTYLLKNATYACECLWLGTNSTVNLWGDLGVEKLMRKFHETYNR